ncbi:hypothetical protein GCL60_16875 (plasmid) [Silvanigrella paludirubra]|uniref:Uncharacterized protein n=1 Tax=Silvanigrella paludirubra TaxID=2499159 RepID=A0A6N6VQ23_9BACT|nr:hypothetical protein [Silvanigrella paludirubra]KAB8035621.1 hypothetical protein GCL60_16875 [Silvanigrella paludirubra]MBX9837486.1 hypothetical protein [Silvanigrellaceae bacterium]
MAKRVTISVKDSEYEKLKLSAESKGKKVIDLINKKVKGKSNIGKILKSNEEIIFENANLKKSINDLQNQINYLQKTIFEVGKLNTEYLAYIKTILTEIVKNTMKDRTKEKVEESINNYLQIAQTESTNEMKKILIM